MAKSLEQREEQDVDPFLTGFSHRNQPTSIDLNVVRLCFQVFLEGDTPGKFSVPVPPVVSEPIYDKKAMSDLTIVKLSHCTSYVDGGRNDIILLCEKVAKEDIQVRFFEENGDWEAFADFQPSQVHKQTAIWFRTPRYKTTDITDNVKVFIQLRRPSDGATSEALPFELLPIDSEPGVLKHKRQKIDNSDQFLNIIKRNRTENFSMQDYPIKPEPRTTPSPYGEASYDIGIGVGTYDAVSPPNNLITSSQMPWNLPSTSSVLPPMDTWNIWPTENPNTNDLQSIINIESGEIIKQLATIDGQSSFPNIQSLSDIIPTEDQNMTDSLTKLINCHINEHTNMSQ